MKTETEEKKYVPEISQREIEELRKSAEAMSEKVIADNIARMKKTWSNRPEAMQYFDGIADFYGQRQKEISAAKQSGKKVIGYFCNFVPVELILAADAIPVRVSSGWYDASKIGDRVVPVEVCPMVRSTIGAKMIGLSPYLELSDALLSVLTCDGMTKLSEILSDYKPVWTMPLPRTKDTEHALAFWKSEIKAAKQHIEDFTGVKINRKKLRAAIELVQGATKAFRRLQDLRGIAEPLPPIRGPGHQRHGVQGGQPHRRRGQASRLPLGIRRPGQRPGGQCLLPARGQSGRLHRHPCDHER